MANGLLGRVHLLRQTVFLVNVVNGAGFMIYLKISYFKIG
jgi:hypothetical protein